MFNVFKESQVLWSRESLKVIPYTFGFIGAQGEFHGTLPKIKRLTDS